MHAIGEFASRRVDVVVILVKVRLARARRGQGCTVGVYVLDNVVDVDTEHLGIYRVEDGVLVRAQILTPRAVRALAVEQPGHLTGGELLGGFGFDVRGRTGTVADAGAGCAFEPVAVRYRAAVRSAHAAYVGIGEAAHAACVVAVRYRAAVFPAHTAYVGIGEAAHAACVEAVRYRAAVFPAHAADVVAAAAYAAAEAAIFYRPIVIAADTAASGPSAHIRYLAFDLDILNPAALIDSTEQAYSI